MATGWHLVVLVPCYLLQYLYNTARESQTLWTFNTPGHCSLQPIFVLHPHAMRSFCFNLRVDSRSTFHSTQNYWRESSSIRRRSRYFPASDDVTFVLICSADWKSGPFSGRRQAIWLLRPLLQALVSLSALSILCDVELNHRHHSL